MMRAEAIVIGLGNSTRRDDGAGLAVARRLQQQRPDLAVVECDGDPLSLIDAWDGVALAVVIDAARSADPAGTVRRLVGFGPPPTGYRAASTHGLGLREAVLLAGTLGRLPARLVLYTVCGRDFGTGEGLTPAVASAIPAIVGRVLAEVESTAEVGG